MMAATIRVRGILATFDSQSGLWSSEDNRISRLLNRHTEMRESLGHATLSYLKENLDYERTIAEYVIQEFGGEIVHVDPYLTGKLDPDVAY